MSNVPNPWLPDNWNLTKQGEYINKYGISVAKRKAREAGTTLGALRPRPVSPKVVVMVQQKSVTNVTEVTTAGSRGYAGSGPPGEEV